MGDSKLILCIYVYICIFTNDDAEVKVDLIFCICVWRKTWRGKTINPLFFKLHPDISFSEPLHSKYKIHFKEVEIQNFTTSRLITAVLVACESLMNCIEKLNSTLYKN